MDNYYPFNDGDFDEQAGIDPKDIAKLPPSQWRTMQRADLDDVLIIERRSYGEHAWDYDDFIEAMTDGITVCKVAIDEVQRITGFVLYSVQDDRFSLVSLGVHPAYRRRGHGRMLISKLIDVLERSNRQDRIVTFLEESNALGSCFLHELGFRRKKRGKWYGVGEQSQYWVWEYRLAKSPQHHNVEKRDLPTPISAP